tara:strand:- start:22824 stop:23564 length:741 start_codon:yes stop_codon:yes gene_type:complete
MKRSKPTGLTVATNTEEILTAMNSHAYFADVQKPNQTHPDYVTYDISCNEDFALHAKHHEWKKIFQFFKDHPIAMGSFATKYVNPTLLDFDPGGKVRIRFSLMPQHLSDIHEPHTSKIIDRIKAIDAFIESGYDVHVNFSPVILYRNWKEDYRELFQMLDDYVDYKDQVLAEVIFLTHSEIRHKHNLTKNSNVERHLWVPGIQESKISQYGGKNLRYKLGLKSDLITQFKDMHGSIIPWNTIRYIF